MGTETALLTAAKSGALVALLALIIADVNLMIVIIVGTIIGIIVYLKEVTQPDAPELTIMGHIINFIMTIIIVLSVTGTVFFFGVELVNTYYPLGTWFWVFTSIIIAQHYKQVWKISTYIGVEIISPILKKSSEVLIQILKKWGGN